MFGSSKTEQLNKAHNDLMEKAIRLSHQNGVMTAENRALTREVDDKNNEILALKSQIKELQSVQEAMIKAASTLGINLCPVIQGDYDIHLSRALSLAGRYIKSEITQKGIPHFEDARKADYMKDFMLEMPGFVDSDEDCEKNKEAKKHYEGVRTYALSLLSTK
ncbi:TPA: hypothetical protein ACSCYS_003344 [Aeromonas veronii]